MRLPAIDSDRGCNEWRRWLEERKAERNKYIREIVRRETALNARVYALFRLTPEEVAVVEASTKYRYGEV